MAGERSTKFEIVTVTPALAASWLGTMRRNRTLSGVRVKRLAEEIRHNRWTLNGQSIIFDKDGALIDGQHRLQAVLVADKAVEMSVVRGVASASWDTIDCGRARTASDALTAKGRTGASLLAPVLRFVYQRTLGVLGSIDRQHLPTTHDIVGLDDEFPAARDSVSWAMSKRFLKNSAVAFLRFVVMSEGPSVEATEFFDGLQTGLRLEPDSAIYAAREMLLQTGLDRKDPRVLLAKLIKAWNAHLAGIPRKKFTWAPEDEEFPTIHMSKHDAAKADKHKKGI